MRYLLIVITFFMGFSSLPAWAMDCYAEHEGALLNKSNFC